MYDDICACSELRDRCFKKAEQVMNLHFSAFINSAGCGFKFTKLIFCKHDLHVYIN